MQGEKVDVFLSIGTVCGILLNSKFSFMRSVIVAFNTLPNIPNPELVCPEVPIAT